MEAMQILPISYLHNIAVKRLVFLSHNPSNSSALCALFTLICSIYQASTGEYRTGFLRFLDLLRTQSNLKAISPEQLTKPVNTSQANLRLYCTMSQNFHMSTPKSENLLRLNLKMSRESTSSAKAISSEAILSF